MPARLARLSALAAVAALAAVTLPSGGAQASGGLLPNGGFEVSAIEPGPAAGRSPQGVLPEGWAFEGVAGLFDHGNGGPAGSTRFAAISIPAGGKSSVCGPEVGCHHNPATEVKEAARAAYTVDPAWRNAVPVAVTPGRPYSLDVDLSWEIVTAGEGAFGKVRWISSAGTVLSTSTAWVVKSSASNWAFRPWGRVTGQAWSPPGAAYAVVLLGATDDAWIGQIRFDNAYFG